MRLPAIAVVLALLAGCATSTNLKPEEQVYLAEREFSAVLQRAAAYVSQPKCTEIAVVACAKPEVVDLMAKYAVEARNALMAAEASLKSNPDSTAYVSYITVARQALALLSAELVKQGIK